MDRIATDEIALQLAWTAIKASGARVAVIQAAVDRLTEAGDGRRLSELRTLLDIMEQLYTLREERLERLIEVGWREIAGQAETKGTE